MLLETIISSCGRHSERVRATNLFKITCSLYNWQHIKKMVSCDDMLFYFKAHKIHNLICIIWICTSVLLSATWNTQQANSSRYRVPQHVAVVVALQTTSWLTHHISITTGDLSKLEKNKVVRGPWKWVVTHREFPELFNLKAPKIYPDHSNTYVGLSVSKKTRTLKIVYLHRCWRHLESVCEYTYLHFGFLGPRHSEWQRVSSGMRLGKKVRVEVVFVLDFEDLKRTEKNESISVLSLSCYSCFQSIA